MGKQLEAAKARLRAAGVTNIKLFPGTNRDATPEQMAEEINRVLARIESGSDESGEYEIVDQSHDD